MEKTLHVEQHRAQDLLNVPLARLRRVTFPDQPQIPDMAGQGMLIRGHWDAFFPVITIAQLSVLLYPVLMHVLAEPFLRES